jgi:hypothetical protein
MHAKCGKFRVAEVIETWKSIASIASWSTKQLIESRDRASNRRFL